MDAISQAWEVLERNFRERGGYEGYLLALSAAGGVLVQDRDAVIMFVVEDGCAHVWFACGRLERLMEFAVCNARVWGYDRLRWERTLDGRSTPPMEFSIKRLWNRTRFKEQAFLQAGSCM